MWTEPNFFDTKTQNMIEMKKMQDYYIKQAMKYVRKPSKSAIFKYEG